MMPRRSFRSLSVAGFTLIELVAVIVISGIIGVILASVIRHPMDAVDAQIRRAELVDMSESALRRMQRDIHAALPNSIRIRSTSGAIGNATCPAPGGAICSLEMLHTIDGGRYRAGLPGNRLIFDGADLQFSVIGNLQNAPTAGQWVVINNQTTLNATFNAYNCPVAGASHNCVRAGVGSTTTNVVLASAFAPTSPPLASPSQHFFIVDTPVTYECNTATGFLTRYQNYPIAAAQVLTPAVVGSRSAELVAGCRFTYQSGVGARGGLVTIELTMLGTNVQEPIRILHQVHVYNSP